MRKKILFMVVLCFMFDLAGRTFHGFAVPVFHIPSASCDELREGWNKLDLNAKEQFADNKSADAYAELIVKTNVPVKKRQIRAFKRVGFLYRSVIPAHSSTGSNVSTFHGSIVTGKILVKDLPELVKLDFVAYVEAAKKLMPKE